MSRLNPQWVESVRGSVNPCPYFQLQSMSIVNLEPGLSVLEIAVDNKHMQPFGIVHGGVFASLIDAAGFWALYTLAPQDMGMTTVELKLNYLAPSMSGKLIGRGKAIKLGRTIGLGEASVEDESGKLLAHGTTTTMLVSNLSLAGGGQAPPKFLD